MMIDEQPVGLGQRNAMLERHKEMAEFEAARNPTEDCVFLVLDPSGDAIARAIYESQTRPEEKLEFEKRKRDAERDGVLPTVFLSMARWDLYRYLSGCQRKLH